MTPTATPLTREEVEANATKWHSDRGLFLTEQAAFAPVRVLATIDALDAARAELDDMRRAWAILDEPSNPQRGAMTAAEVAQRFRAESERLQSALAEATAELARIQRLPELPWAEVTAVIMQSFAMLSRAGDKATAQRLVEALDKGKTYVGRLVADRDLLSAQLREATEARGEALAVNAALVAACADALTLEHLSQPAYGEVRDRVRAALSNPTEAGNARDARLQNAANAEWVRLLVPEWLLVADARLRTDVIAEHDARVRAVALEEFCQSLGRKGYYSLADEARALLSPPAPSEPECATCGGCPTCHGVLTDDAPGLPPWCEVCDADRFNAPSAKPSGGER